MSLSSDQRAILARLFGDFALRWFERAKDDFERDYEAASVLMAILQANIRIVGEDARLNKRFGKTPPPNELRVPISLREAAKLIGMPRERLRRKSRLLVDAEAIELVGDGYIVPAAAIRPASSRTHGQAVAMLHRRMQAAGFGVPDIPVSDGPDNWRQGVLRVMGDAVVAWIRLASEPFNGDVQLAVVTAAVMQANDYPRIDGAPATPRPIPVHALAASLHRPRESVRRHVAALEKDGWLQRQDQGIILAPGVLDRPEMASVDPLYELTHALFARLAAHGASFSADYLSDDD